MRQLIGDELKDFCDRYISYGLKPNYSELDIRLGYNVWREKAVKPDAGTGASYIHRLAKDNWEELYIKEEMTEPVGLLLAPKKFVLVDTIEKFFLPMDVKGVIGLRSFAAKSSLEQSSSLVLRLGWSSNDSNGLILELQNCLDATILHLKPGDAIASVEFFEV